MADDTLIEAAASVKPRDADPPPEDGDLGNPSVDCHGTQRAIRHTGLRAMRACEVTLHVAQNTRGRSSAIDGRAARHRGYALSQRLRRRIEEVFGWMKTMRGFQRTHLPRFGPDGPCQLPRGNSLQPGADG